MQSSNVDAQEVAKFERLAERWWDADGEFKPLHDMNGPRVEYLRSRCVVKDARILDAGCGGGLLTEALADLGGDVTGIDAGEAPLAVARLHAAERGLAERIEYVAATPESFLASGPGAFDVIACLEMLEHVPDMPAAVAALAQLAKPGANVFFSTISRTAKAFALAIVGAEYVLNILPKGTHAYENLIRPSELASACRAAGLHVADVVGVRYNPFTRRCALSNDVSVNYLLHAQRPADVPPDV